MMFRGFLLGSALAAACSGAAASAQPVFEFSFDAVITDSISQFDGTAFELGNALSGTYIVDLGVPDAVNFPGGEQSLFPAAVDASLDVGGGFSIVVSDTDLALNRNPAAGQESITLSSTNTNQVAASSVAGLDVTTVVLNLTAPVGTLATDTADELPSLLDSFPPTEILFGLNDGTGGPGVSVRAAIDPNSIVVPEPAGIATAGLLGWLVLRRRSA